MSEQTHNRKKLAEQALGREFYVNFEKEFRGGGEYPSWARYLKALQNREKDNVVVDLGAGQGFLLSYLREGCRRHSYLAVEPDEASCRALAATGLEFQRATLQEFLENRAAESVDIFILTHVVEHLPWEELVLSIVEMKRVLKPKGLIFMECPNCFSMLTAAINFWQDPTHIRPLVPSTLDFLLRHFGFFIHEHMELSPSLPAELQSMVNDPLWKPILKTIYGNQDFVIVAEKTAR